MVCVGKKNLVNDLGLTGGLKNEYCQQENPDMERIHNFFQNFIFFGDEAVTLSDCPERVSGLAALADTGFVSGS
jgi:hypothetical protein